MYWRGSIKFRFTFAKTKFHAGRVIAAYVPASYDTVATGVLSNNVPAPEISSGLVQPFQEVTKEEYESLLSKMPKSIRWEDLSFYETEDGTSTNATLACTSDGNCEIVDISA